MAIIEIKDLDFAYNGEAVLKDVNLTIWQKDFVAIIGPNGGGKTTLLKLVLGLLTPAKGTVRVDGKSPQEASPCIGYVPQDVHTNRSFPITAIDVVLMAASQGVFLIAFVAMARNEYSLYAAAALIGFNFGGNFALFPTMTADTFGAKYIGQNYGWVFLAYGAGGIVFPILGAIQASEGRTYRYPLTIRFIQ